LICAGYDSESGGGRIFCIASRGGRWKKPWSVSVDPDPDRNFCIVILTQHPVWYTVVILSVFAATSILFVLFDCLVQRRQARVVLTAMKQNIIVSSLFPKNIRAKMMEQVGQNNKLSSHGKAGLKSFLNDAENKEHGKNSLYKSKPIADLFADTSIMFADIAG
jgi:hypothetical protein